MKIAPASGQRTAVLLATFLLCVVATACTALPLYSPSKQSKQHQTTPTPPVAKVLGEKISTPLGYATISGFAGPVVDDGHVGAFALQDFVWLPDNGNLKSARLALPLDTGTSRLLESFANSKTFQQIVVTIIDSTGTETAWKFSGASLAQFTLKAGDTYSSFAEIVVVSSNVIKVVASPEPIDCSTITKQPDCEQQLNCIWIEPKKANGPKSVVKVQGICQPYTPPPVVETTTQFAPVVTERETTPPDSTAATKRINDTTGPTPITKQQASDKNGEKSSGTTDTTSGGSTSGNNASDRTTGGGTTDSSGGTSSGGSDSSGSTSGGSTSGGGSTDSSGGGSTTF